jgi:hypothetical protein
MNRRAFLKGIAALVAMPVVARLPKIAQPTASQVARALPYTVTGWDKPFSGINIEASTLGRGSPLMLDNLGCYVEGEPWAKLERYDSTVYHLAVVEDMT